VANAWTSRFRFGITDFYRTEPAMVAGGLARRPAIIPGFLRPRLCFWSGNQVANVEAVVGVHRHHFLVDVRPWSLARGGSHFGDEAHRPYGVAQYAQKS
jgi:hypothetical protein